MDDKKANEIVGNASFQASADLAQRKSIVLLRNENKSLPLNRGIKVYFETYQRPSGRPGNIEPQIYADAAYRNDITFVKTPDAADIVLLWVKPSMRPLFPSNDKPLRLILSECAVDVSYINQLTAKKPTILAINFTSPFVINEVYNDKSTSIKGVIATFGCSPEALLDIVTGKFSPTGKMPFTTPVSEEAVLKNKEDVPGYLEGDAYGLFKYDEGLTYK